MVGLVVEVEASFVSSRRAAQSHRTDRITSSLGHVSTGQRVVCSIPVEAEGGGSWLAWHSTSRRWADLIAWTCEHAHRAECGGGVVEDEAVVEGG